MEVVTINFMFFVINIEKINKKTSKINEKCLFTKLLTLTLLHYNLTLLHHSTGKKVPLALCVLLSFGRNALRMKQKGHPEVSTICYLIIPICKFVF